MDYLVYPRREGYALLEGWQVLLRCCDVCFQKNCSPRFPLIECRCSSNSKLPTNHRFAERIVSLAQQHDVINFKHDLVPGLRTQFLTQCVCTVRNEVQTGGSQSTLSQPSTHRYQRRHPQTTENRHVQVCAPVCSAACKPPGFCCNGIWASTPFTRDTVRSLAVELMSAKSQSSPKNTPTLRFFLTTTRYYARTKNGFR
jgi:hypothetical protein